MVSSQKLADSILNYTQKVFDDVFDGDKFPDSFGITRDYVMDRGIDYFTLRKRCRQLFVENTYYSGIIKRLIRNEIFTGMFPEPTPIASVLWPNLKEDEREAEAAKYAEQMADAFNLYANDFSVFDYKQQRTFTEYQEEVRIEAMICGDVLVVNRINQRTGLPCWDIISGNNIKTPFDYSIKKGNTITHGVERDRQGRHVAYWVEEYKDDEYQFTRIPVVGEKSGRQISWLVYGGNKLLDSVRGTPVLASALYMLRDLDRYRDAELRAAVVSSIIPFFFESDVSAPPANSVIKNEALKKAGINNNLSDTEKPKFDFVPGMVAERLRPGETVKSFTPSHPNINFKVFEDTIVSAICWSNEIPPEIVKLLYGTSYSASRQANTEFEIYLKYRAFKNAKDFCQIIYQEFVNQSVLLGDLILPGFQEVMFNVAGWKLRGAWLKCEWSAMSRPSVDMSKEASAYVLLKDNLVMTHDQISRRFTGISFRSLCNIRLREKRLMERLGLETVKNNPTLNQFENNLKTKNKNMNNDEDENNSDDSNGQNEESEKEDE